MKNRLGLVTLERRGRTARASLNARGRWAFAGDRDLVDVLRMASDLVDVDDRSPAHGPFGPRQLAELAEITRGTVTLATLPGQPAGTIY